MSGDVAVKSLVYTKEAKEVSRNFVSCCIAFALPKQGGEVVSFTQHGMFSDVEALSKGVQMEEAASKFEIRICDGTGGVRVGDEVVNDILGPLKAPEDGASVKSTSGR
jgi:hypothetical protein